MTWTADRSAAFAILAALSLSLGGCAQVQLAAHTAKGVATAPAQPDGAYKVGDPYQVFGVWYYPAADSDYEEMGVASWYGREFHGRRTANGAVFDMNALSAAHRTLPMPSLVRVTNLDNGRSLVLTVNDRGPFARGRIIDVSRRAAQLLGFFEKGTAKVRVEAVRARPGKPLTVEASNEFAPKVVAPAAPALPITPASVVVATAATSTPVGITPAIYIQAGAFADPENARRLKAELVRFGAASTAQTKIDDRLIYRVRVGPMVTVDDAEALRDRLVAAGYSDARLVID